MFEGKSHGNCPAPAVRKYCCRPVVIRLRYGRRRVERDFADVLEQISGDTGSPVEANFVPVSALIGDNIVHRSAAMPWYEGPSLLELLESLPASEDTRTASFRFPVQRVLRPDSAFRGFAGQIASGTIHVGDAVTVASSGRSAEVERIVTWDGDLTEAHAPLSVTLVLSRELDISRGDLILSANEPASVSKSLTAALVWMDSRPLDLNRRYLLKHTSRTVPAFVTSIEYRADIGTLTHEPAETLEMNNIGAVSLSLLQPIAVDLYRENRSTGAFILIDPLTNGTVAAGMITAAGDVSAGLLGPVTAEERTARWGHRGGVLELIGPSEAIDRVERSLFDLGAITVRVDALDTSDAVIRSIVEAGIIALRIRLTNSSTLTARAGEKEITVDTDDVHKLIAAVHQLLTESGVFVRSGKAGAP